MIQFQKKMQNCIDQIIQHNSMLQNIFTKISQQGGRVLLVGGAVRDCLLNRFSFDTDLDFEVYHLELDQLEAILKEFRPVSLVGKSFGVLRLHGVDADWSIPRQDSAGRKPIVQIDPHMSFEQAFKRRDLTINAMGIDVQLRELIDPYGGLKDLENRILRAPNIEFFVQDPLRLFRVMQFAARFDMQPDVELNAVCATMNITKVSPERIEEEFKKLFLKSEQPSIGLSWLYKIGRWSELFDKTVFSLSICSAVDCIALISGMDTYQKLGAMWSIFVYEVVLQQKVEYSSSMSIDIKKRLKDVVVQYVSSKKVMEYVTCFGYYVHYIPLLVQSGEVKDYKWLAHWLSSDTSLQMLAMVGTCWYGQDIIDTFVQKAQQGGVLEYQEEPLVTGKDLLSFVQGQRLGELVRQAYEIQINSGIVDKEELINSIRF